ncbi:MAG: hypothetical protein FWD72_06450, partial [Eggerthellaceae bacterium]|nr:hypothetical protein [Eggerthellaceae bacterium]
AVVYDFEEKAIRGTAKALTTREDLSRGILEALDALPAELVKAAEVISLSTTLATNACVEDKGGAAKLVFFGGDSRVLDRCGAQYGLPPTSEIYLQESYTKFSGEVTQEPDWDLFCAQIDGKLQGLDGVGVIEMNAMKNSAVVEKKAKELLLEKMAPDGGGAGEAGAPLPLMPVVCGYELSNELNSLQRGSSTLLNARLVPIIKAFMDAIRTAMAARGISAAITIVRSDGSLMSEEFAHVRPIETLLCGPAASVLGSAHFVKEENCIVVDMGGTTTDIALIKGGVPFRVTDGITVGKWRTFVDGLYVRTFGLGGDSAIHYKERTVVLEDYRVVPLCVAATTYPQIVKNLEALLIHEKNHSHFVYEHYLLLKDIADNPRYDDAEKSLCAALKDGPLTMGEAAEVLGKDVYNFKVGRLVKEGVIQVCGLTPTDIMHIKGDFMQFSREASLLAAQFVAASLEVSVAELCDLVFDEVKHRLYRNIVKAMLENSNSHYLKNGFSEGAERLIDEAYEYAKAAQPGLASLSFTTDFAIAGVGAPVRLFLDDVARMLGTRAVYPEHYAVANALGAVVGNIHATCTVEVKPNYDNVGAGGYAVYGRSATRSFSDLRSAEAFALEEARYTAQAEAVKRGAQGEVVVTSELEKHEIKSKGYTVFLGTKAIAHAVGSLGF